MSQERMTPRSAAWVELDRYWASLGKWPDQDFLNDLDYRLDDLQDEGSFDKEDQWKDLLNDVAIDIGYRATYDGERIVSFVKIGTTP